MLQVLFEQWMQCGGKWDESQLIIQARTTHKGSKVGGRRWMMRQDILKKYGGCVETADQLIQSKEADPLLKNVSVREHPDLPGRSDLKLYLIWDESYEQDSEDVVMDQLFSLGQKDSHGKKKKKTKPSKKGKGKKRGRSSSSSPTSRSRSSSSSTEDSDQSSSSSPSVKPSKKSKTSKKDAKRNQKKTKKAKKTKKELKKSSESSEGSSDSEASETQKKKPELDRKEQEKRDKDRQKEEEKREKDRLKEEEKREKDRLKDEEKREKDRLKEEEKREKERQKEEEKKEKAARKKEAQEKEKEKAKTRASAKKACSPWMISGVCVCVSNNYNIIMWYDMHMICYICCIYIYMYSHIFTLHIFSILQNIYNL